MIVSLDIVRLVKMPKVVLLPLGEYSSANNRNFIEIYGDLYDQTGELIPRLQIHYIYKIQSLGCNVKIALHHNQVPGRRIFQIEIYDRFYPSHRQGNEIWYGPHMYYMGTNRKLTSKLTCDDSHRERWLKRFYRHTNISTREAPGMIQRKLL
jgi:hypothetical protein